MRAHVCALGMTPLAGLLYKFHSFAHEQIARVWYAQCVSNVCSRRGAIQFNRHNDNAKNARHLVIARASLSR